MKKSIFNIFSSESGNIVEPLIIDAMFLVAAAVVVTVGIKHIPRLACERILVGLIVPMLIMLLLTAGALYMSIMRTFVVAVCIIGILVLAWTAYDSCMNKKTTPHPEVNVQSTFLLSALQPVTIEASERNKGAETCLIHLVSPSPS